MCFSATANFVGSGVLGTVGVVTLTKVKHRRELLFATLPTLFAVDYDMGAAFMLYAQGSCPFVATQCASFRAECEEPQ